MTTPKPFQLATVEQALRTLASRDGARRFLVADEVGLGKTVIAQQIMHRLMAGRTRPLAVFYLCSNLSLARQNQDNLLKVLPHEERSTACCPVDRLTLMPAARPPSHPRLHFYTLTPDTSLPLRKGRRRDGLQEERALIQVLVERLWPALLAERGEDLFQRQARRRWPDVLAKQRRKVASHARLPFIFWASVRREFNLAPYERVLPKLKGCDSLDLIAHLRNALAAAGIEEARPDLIILDEFQRFSDLVLVDEDQDKDDEADAAERVARALRGGRANPCQALLLL